VFRAALAASEWRDPLVPVVAGVDGSLVTRRDDAVRTLSRQLAEPIDWSRVLETLVERGCRVFVELGCGTALSRMVNERFADAHARSLDDFRSLDGAAAWARARLGE
jgi:[acyl-carrier-protein] S-malonyltransferase